MSCRSRIWDVRAWVVKRGKPGFAMLCESAKRVAMADTRGLATFRVMVAVHTIVAVLSRASHFDPWWYRGKDLGAYPLPYDVEDGQWALWTIHHRPVRRRVHPPHLYRRTPASHLYTHTHTRARAHTHTLIQLIPSCDCTPTPTVQWGHGLMARRAHAS